MQRQPVVPSLLRSTEKLPKHSVLELEFTNGRIYQYFDVPQEVYDELADHSH